MARVVDDEYGAALSDVEFTVHARLHRWAARPSEKLRDDLVTGERDATDTVRDAMEERRTTPQDPQDAAQGEIQEQFRQALHDAHGPRLADIQRALEKIDEGTYGLSDESDEPIPIARLQAVPEAILTVDEAERREQRARLGIAR